MTLTILRELDQGTDEWHDQRRGLVTASVVDQLITPKTIQPANNDHSRSLVALLVAERITGWTDPTCVGDDMLRGWEDEPRAVEAYGEHFAPVTTAGFMVRDDWGFRIGYSPDGLVGDDGLIEVKPRRPKKHLQTILTGEVPSENFAQLQCGLLVSGRAWCDYVSFCGGLPLWTKRVYPDPKWQAVLVEAVQKFEDAAAEIEAAWTTATKGLPATERTPDLYAAELRLA